MQFRCKESIYRVPNQLFYGGRVTTHSGLAGRPVLVCDERPDWTLFPVAEEYCCWLGVLRDPVDLENVETRVYVNKSLLNTDIMFIVRIVSFRAEAEAVLKKFKQLLKYGRWRMPDGTLRKLTPKDFLIMTFYSCKQIEILMHGLIIYWLFFTVQVTELKHLFRAALDRGEFAGMPDIVNLSSLDDIEIMSIRKAQGREAEIVLLSMVNSFFVPHATKADKYYKTNPTSFVLDPKQLCIALTRAR